MTYKLNLTLRWSTGDCLFVNSQVLQFARIKIKRKGIEWSHSSLKVFAKFALCSNCSQYLDVCSLNVARKMFATARTLGFLLK